MSKVDQALISWRDESRRRREDREIFCSLNSTARAAMVRAVLISIVTYVGTMLSIVLQ